MRKHIKHLRNEKGLTLIELLAVIVILGIIAAIAIPMIGNVVEDSREKAEVNEALNIISAAKQKYAVENVKGNISYTGDQLSDYIKNVDSGVSVSYDADSREWSISGHPAVGVYKNSEDNSGTVKEAELQSWLENPGS